MPFLCRFIRIDYDMFYFRPHKTLFLIFLLSLSCVYSAPKTHAQIIIRDTEIESYLSQWFAPILKANGMEKEQIKIILVQSDQVNAFVAGGANIFFYTGLIELTETPEELIGVFAHELGHVTGGHLIRGRQALRQASYESILGSIIGVGTALLSGNGAAANAGISAGQTLAQRRFLSTTRHYESSADQAAISSMVQAGIDPKGVYSFLQKLEGQELLPASQQSEYMRTHPLTRNRVESVKNTLNAQKSLPPVPREWVDQHALIKAKLAGFIHPEQIEWQYDTTDTSKEALYARAIAAYRQNNLDKALSFIEQLQNKFFNNPYILELKGQILGEFGQASKAIPYYQKALQYLPHNDSGLLLSALGKLYIQLFNQEKKDSTLNLAIKTLNKAVIKEPQMSSNHRLLAIAYGNQDNTAMAQYHLAQESMLQGSCKRARKHLKYLEGEENISSSIEIKIQDLRKACADKK